MPAPYGLDLRQKAVEAVDRGERKSHICKTLQISRNTLDLWLKRRDETGSVAPKREHPLYPKKTYRYRERNEQQRAAFLSVINTYAKERMVYVDEAGINNTLDYLYGYCHHSERFPGECLGHRTERVSLISVAPMTFEGYCNSTLVCQWIEEFLLPELIPGQFVIIDNSSFHPKNRIQQLLRQAGCEVILLPPYSPDLNKIEKFWARLKHYLRKLLGRGWTLTDAIDETFKLVS